jgi:hypothetical protein
MGEQTGARSWVHDDRTVNREIESIKQTLESLVSLRVSPTKPILKRAKDKPSDKHCK